jgi:hypothetical protein
MSSKGHNNLFQTRFKYIEFSLRLSRSSRDRAVYESGLPYLSNRTVSAVDEAPAEPDHRDDDDDIILEDDLFE